MTADDATRSDSVLGPNGPRVCKTLCDTCIFRPGNPMHLRPGRVRQMVRDSLAQGGFITCHKTLSYGGYKAAAAVCRGFFDRFGTRSNVLRAWSRLGRFDEVAPPTDADREVPR